MRAAAVVGAIGAAVVLIMGAVFSGGDGERYVSIIAVPSAVVVMLAASSLVASRRGRPPR